MLCPALAFGLMYVVEEEAVSLGGILHTSVCCQLIISDEYLHVNRDTIIVISDSNTHKTSVGWTVKFCGHYSLSVGARFPPMMLFVEGSEFGQCSGKTLSEVTCMLAVEYRCIYSLKARSSAC